MWALIVNNKVVEIAEEDPTNKYHESFVWVFFKENNVTVGMNYEDGKFTSVLEQSQLAAEKAWRNLELSRADQELNKVQDSDPKSTGTVTDWRAYRKELRAWPENINFPDVSSRPVAPDRGK